MNQSLLKRTNFSTYIAVIVTVINIAGLAVADPTIDVVHLGPNDDGDSEWRVDVVPDTSLFTDGSSSLAAELGFQFDGSTLLDAIVNESVWAFELPGFNPFTDTITTGLVATETLAFVSYGSELVTDVVELLTFTTAGSDHTTLSWGGQNVRPGRPGSFTGARISQAGLNFDGISGNLSAGNVQPCDPDSQGDLDGNGKVEFADFLTLSKNFGLSVAVHSDGDIDCNGTVEFTDFLVLSGNFGQAVRGAEAVPEPHIGQLAMLVIAAMVFRTWSSQATWKRG